MRIKLNKDSIVGLLAVPALALSVAGVMFQATPAFADPSTEKPPLTVSGGAKSAKAPINRLVCLVMNLVVKVLIKHLFSVLLLTFYCLSSVLYR